MSWLFKKVGRAHIYILQMDRLHYRIALPADVSRSSVIIGRLYSGAGQGENFVRSENFVRGEKFGQNENIESDESFGQDENIWPGESFGRGENIRLGESFGRDESPGQKRPVMHRLGIDSA